jgi:VCBS repeat-containing protein
VITWIPTAAQVGANAVTVRATNSAGRAATQSFTITVANVNDAPVAAADTYTATGGSTLNVAAPGVLANDRDADADAMTAVLSSGPTHGTLALNANGSFAYTPAAGFKGADSFTYRAFDGTLYSAVTTVTINVVSQAPVAVNDSYVVVQDTTLTVAAPGVLANDRDADGNAMTASLVLAPAHGTLTLSASGSFTYRPASGYRGADSFTYRAFDGSAYSANATVSITVGANHAPVANNDSVMVPVRGSGSYTPVAIAVLANDTDADNNINPASVTISTSPTKGGTVTVNANGTVSYVPKVGYRGQDTFRYRVSDSAGAQSNAATVTVTVQ